MLWLIVPLVVISIIAFAAGGALVGLGLLLVLLVLAGVLVRYGIRTVPVAHMAMVTLFGRRMPHRILGEGWHFILPIVENLLIEDFRVRTERIEIKPIRTQFGAEMFAVVTIGWKPPKGRFGQYIELYGETGAKLKLEAASRSEVRQFAAKRDWKAVKSSLDAIEEKLKDHIRAEIKEVEIETLYVEAADLVSGTEIAKEADKEARERVQRKSQEYEMETLLRRVKKLQETAEKLGIPEDAVDITATDLMVNEAIREGRGQYIESKSLERFADKISDKIVEAINKQK